eukprot:6179487-Pleurochrysis_carterae.AAC.1
MFGQTLMFALNARAHSRRDAHAQVQQSRDVALQSSAPARMCAGHMLGHRYVSGYAHTCSIACWLAQRQSRIHDLCSRMRARFCLARAISPTPG